MIAVLILFIALAGCSDKLPENQVVSAAPAKDVESVCPKGIVNDTYPGSCGLYVDKDSNMICDNSEV